MRASALPVSVGILALAACAVALPTGPAVVALPPEGKNLAQFQQEDAGCRGYAQQQIGYGSPQQAANQDAIGSAALGTAVGAAAGAAIGAAAGAAGTGGQSERERDCWPARPWGPATSRRRPRCCSSVTISPIRNAWPPAAIRCSRSLSHGPTHHTDTHPPIPRITDPGLAHPWHLAFSEGSGQISSTMPCFIMGSTAADPVEVATR